MGMETLLNYLNALSRDEQAAFSARCETTVGYLRKAASVGQLIHPVTCSRIEKVTSGAVTRRDLRPDDWVEIWPELAEKSAETHQSTARIAQAATETVAQGVAHA